MDFGAQSASLWKKVVIDTKEQQQQKPLGPLLPISGGRHDVLIS